MEWFWNQYLPVLNNAVIFIFTVGSVHQLKSLPDAMIINGEADVLKMKEKPMQKLMRAGVSNRSTNSRNHP
ncbi:MAG: hypothetical protein ACLR13_10040 [Acutalibacteraceae bacterium]